MWQGGCKAWAKAAFPKLNEAEAIEKLWENIFKACRVDLKDPIAAWRQHDQTLSPQGLLNKAHFVKVHYMVPTDLMVGLSEKHVWEAVHACAMGMFSSRI